MKLLSRKKDKYEDYREIQTKDEARKFQHKVYGEYCNRYNKDREKMKKIYYTYKSKYADIPMESYLGTEYYRINAYLRGIEKPIEGYTEYCYRMLIDRINEIIYCAPSIPENIVIYRGISEEALRIIKNSVRESGAYMEKGFMSATLLKEIIPEEFPRYKDILKIYVPKGAHALGVDNINDRGEFEILFPEEQHIKYIKRYKDKKLKRNIYEFELINYDLD